MVNYIERDGVIYQQIPAPVVVSQEGEGSHALGALKALWKFMHRIIDSMCLLLLIVLVLVVSGVTLHRLVLFIGYYLEAHTSFWLFWKANCFLDVGWGCFIMSWIVWFGRILLPAAFGDAKQALKRVFEKAKVGSKIETVSNGPKNQFQIVSLGGEMIGQGFRAMVDGQDVLVTAHHCVNFDEDFLIVGRHDKKIKINRKDFILRPGFDVAFLPFSAEMVVLGLAKAKLGYVKGNMVVRVGTVDKASFGSLCRLDFSRVKYSGSTKGGFSGAPYTLGNFVYGMHQGYVGEQNYGLNAGVLKIALAVDLEEEIPAGVEEDSDEWLLAQIEGGADYELQTTGSPDAYGLRVGDKYFLLDTMDDGDLDLVTKIKNKTKNKNYKNKNLLGDDEPVTDLEFEHSLRQAPVLNSKEAIPLAAMASSQIVASDQIAGPSFLGERPKVMLRPKPLTRTTVTNTHPTTNLAMGGQNEQPTQSGNRLPSTKPSPLKTDKDQERKSLIAALLGLYSSLQPGDQAQIERCLITLPSNVGLKRLLTELQKTSIGKRPSGTAV